MLFLCRLTEQSASNRSHAGGCRQTRVTAVNCLLKTRSCAIAQARGVVVHIHVAVFHSLHSIRWLRQSRGGVACAGEGDMFVSWVVGEAVTYASVDELPEEDLVSYHALVWFPLPNI